VGFEDGKSLGWLVGAVDGLLTGWLVGFDNGFFVGTKVGRVEKLVDQPDTQTVHLKNETKAKQMVLLWDKLTAKSKVGQKEWPKDLI